MEVKPGLRLAITGITIILSLAYNHIKPLYVLKLLLVWLSEGFANINELLDWALVPVTAFLKPCWTLIKKAFIKQILPEGT